VDPFTRPEFGRAALLSIDVQRDVLDRGPFAFATPRAELAAMVRVVEAFRAARRPIIHVVRLYLPDGSNADLCRRDAIAAGGGALVAGTSGSEIIADLLPPGRGTLDAHRLLGGRFQPLSSHESVMYKPRWGAFYGTRLLEHLRVHRVTTVVVIGCNFPNCPRATIVEASERDLRVIAVNDALSRFGDHDAVDMRDIGVAVMTAAEVADRLTHAFSATPLG
jgi:nicotinamidase-related amidase